MREHRLHLDEPVAGRAEVSVSGDRARYLVRVLRLGVDAPLTVFDGAGGEYRARITALGRDRVTLAVDEHLAVERESPLSVRLLQGVSRGERMDLVIQKATELGVAEIVPVITKFSVVKLDGERAERRQRHWQAVAVAACEQCRRNRVPVVAPVCTFAEALAAEAPARLRLLLAAEGESRLATLARPSGGVTLLIGPEGGLAPGEREAATAQGFRAVRLGPRILRTETAAIAALALLQGTWGDAAG